MNFAFCFKPSDDSKATSCPLACRTLLIKLFLPAHKQIPYPVGPESSFLTWLYLWHCLCESASLFASQVSQFSPNYLLYPLYPTHKLFLRVWGTVCNSKYYSMEDCSTIQGVGNVGALTEALSIKAKSLG